MSSRRFMRENAMGILDLDTIVSLREQGNAKPVPALSCVLTSKAARVKSPGGVRIPNAWQFTCDVLGRTVLCYTRSQHVADLVNRISLRDKISLSGDAFGGTNWSDNPLFVEAMVRLKNQSPA